MPNSLTAIRLQDTDGNLYRWSIKSEPRAIGWKGGWSYTDHEGYTRMVEGNWRELVYRFKFTAENYSLTLVSELS